MNKIDTSSWKEFKIGDLFTIVKGTRLTKASMKDGTIRFVGASSLNNGITAHIGNDKCIHPANTISLTYNGSVGEAFYQDKPFWASDDVNILYPKFEFNKYIALFIIPILKAKGKQYAFIDKWKKCDMEQDFIKLPAQTNNFPNWLFMENYMKQVELQSKQKLRALLSVQWGGYN